MRGREPSGIRSIGGNALILKTIILSLFRTAKSHALILIAWPLLLFLVFSKGFCDRLYPLDNAAVVAVSELVRNFLVGEARDTQL